MEKGFTEFRLLWPQGSQYNLDLSRDIDESYIKNLGVEQIVDAICINDKYQMEIRHLICDLCEVPEVIQYRLDILEDFLNQPGLIQRFEKILPIIQQLEDDKLDLYSLGADQFRKIAWQLEKLYIYVECIEEFSAIFSDYVSELKSEGLLHLSRYIEDMIRDETYQSLKKDIPKLKQQIQNISFVTIGINLDESLKPVEAVFLSLESKPYKKPSLLSNFLGLKSADEKVLGLSQFQRFLSKPAFENALFRDLEDIFKEAVLPIGQTIRQYTRFHTQPLIKLAFDLSFYIGAAKWIQKLTGSGLSMCKPIVLSKEQREYKIENLRDMILAMDGVRIANVNLNEKIVGNDVEFGPKGRIFILTGPNQGGKTTYTRSIGLAQLLFQAGLYIPGTSAAISPVDWICTHFNEEETPDVNDGRLGEESQRLAKIFDKATPYSLVLLNESFSSTSPGEGLYLAEDIIKGMVMIGCRTVFATHFHELAANIKAINAQFPDSDTRLISMVAGVERTEGGSYQAKRTYKVIPSPPQGVSYAQDIARLYGISLEQITTKLQDRGILHASKY